MNNMEAQRTYKDILWQDPDRMSGAVCFYGTRIPVAYLFDYLDRGRDIGEFVKDYRVAAEVVHQVVKLAPDGIAGLLEDAA